MSDLYESSAARHVAHSSAYMYAQSLIMSLFGFIFWFYATKVASTTFVGEISALYLLSSFATTLLTFSIPPVAQRYIPIYEARGNKKASIFVARLLVGAGFIISASVWAFIFFLSAPFSSFFLKNASLSYLIRDFSFAVFFGLLSAFFSGLLVAHQKFKVYALINAAYYAGFYFGALIALNRGMGLSGVIEAWTIANFVFLVVFAVASSKSLQGKSEKVPILGMLKYGLPLYASSLVSYGSSLVDRYAVLFLSTLGVLGVYNIAISSSGVITAFLGAAISVTYPFLSGMFGKKGADSLKSVVRLSVRYLTLAFVPLALGASAISAPVLSLFGSGQYQMGALPLSTVLIFSALTLSGGIYANALLAKGKSHIILLASLASLAANVTLSVLLIRPFGMEGAAIGLSSSSLAYFIALSYYAEREGVFVFDVKATWKAWLSSVVMSVLVLLAELLLKRVIYIPVYIIIGATSWILLMWALKPLNSQDASILEQIIPNRVKKAARIILKIIVSAG